MTVIVGVRCSDGIVIGADSAATFAAGHQPLMKHDSDKLQIVDNRLIIATTGSVGLAQRFRAVVDVANKHNIFAKDCLAAVTHLARETILNFQNTHIHRDAHMGWGLGAFVGGVFKDGVELVEFPWTDFQPEVKTGKLFFGSMGSGQMLADPFLSFVSRVMWQDKQPTVDVARFGVHWALSHTIDCAPGGVGHPIKLATLSQKGGQWGCRLLEEQELQEQAQYIQAIEEYMRNYAKTGIESAEAAPPPPPPPNNQAN
ncbi:MAG TPA: hypothetical protein VGH23_11010 [Rhizomicrobium sp.]